ncbi:T3SS (YopN, CesT) and YbjN peptide-binding chaperone 1 [Gordonia rhizosphera]|uniref:Uncharacterized protein n=1 Tax=Gordonia rhizosphera NBRC 16068 TaxID=1108045 RepID=K6V9Z3_9ACTN|nr:hypothetical protein [Gordonia rhizosphera]GAB93038.1 hypothetical protein GORHZ_202_00270 [Gordonia rhizosphera NBRC 16068]
MPANPGGRSDLQNWLSDTLEPVLGHVPEFDDDGDLPIQFDTGTVFVTVDDDDDLIEIFSPVVADIGKTDYAAFVVHALNHSYPILKFALHGKMLMLRAYLYADPPVEAHLFRCLDECRTVFQDAQEIADDVSGRLAWSPEPESSTDDDLPTLIQILVQLDAGGEVELSDEEVARICGHDREAILRYIRIVEQQMINWRNSADEALTSGDSDEAEVCLHEAEGWAKTARDLRGALRAVALG